MTCFDDIFHHCQRFEFFQMYVFLVFTKDTYVWINLTWLLPRKLYYRGADKSLARPGRKQAMATEDFDVHLSYLLS
jgi:hypothetical protein